MAQMMQRFLTRNLIAMRIVTFWDKELYVNLICVVCSSKAPNLPKKKQNSTKYFKNCQILQRPKDSLIVAFY